MHLPAQTVEPPESPANSTQCHALAAYLALGQLDRVWRRKLVLLAGVAASSRAVALGALAAGAAVLWVNADRSILREANQAGATDFNVDALSEALRILKNEIRKGNPISVGLAADPRQAWIEALGRGLQPHAVWSADGSLEGAATAFKQRGAYCLPQSIARQGIEIEEAENWRDRRAKDAAMLAAVSASTSGGSQSAALQPETGREAVQWFTTASALFSRDLHRCYFSGWFAPDRAASNRGV